jgi:hypothetical protein
MDEQPTWLGTLILAIVGTLLFCGIAPIVLGILLLIFSAITGHPIMPTPSDPIEPPVEQSAPP